MAKAQPQPQQPSYRVRLGYSDYQDPGVDCSQDEPITQQQFAKECDVNEIVKRYIRTGVIDHRAQVQAVFGDFTSVDDFHTGMNKIIAAQEAFEELPALVRKRFDNDPAKLLAFLQDPNNVNEGIQLGLLEPKVDDSAASTTQGVPPGVQPEQKPATSGSTSPT